VSRLNRFQDLLPKGFKARSTPTHSGVATKLDTGDSTSARVCLVNGRRYVSNLLWQSLSSPASAASEIKAFMAEREMNLYATNEGMTTQGGFASVSLEYKKIYQGSYSLASVLADYVQKTVWLAAFRVDENQIVVVGCNDGRIVPGMDLLDWQDNAFSVLKRQANEYPWESIYTDIPEVAARFTHLNVITTTLSEILVTAPVKAARIRLIINRKKQLLIGSVATILIGAGLVYGYQSMERAKRAKKAAEEAQRNRLSIESQRRDDLRRAREELHKSAVLPRWKDRPLNTPWLQACARAFNRMPINIAAWTAEEATCQDTELSVKFKRAADTSLLDFSTAAQALVSAGEVQSLMLEDNVAMIRITILSKPLNKRPDIELLTAEQWQIPFVSQMQMLGAKYDYKMTPAVIAKLPQWVEDTLKDEASLRDPWWSNYRWSFALSGVTAIEVLNNLGDAPGFVVEQISVNMGGSNAARWTWTASGEANVKKSAVFMPPQSQNR